MTERIKKVIRVAALEEVNEAQGCSTRENCMKFPQGKSNKQHAFISILSKRLTLISYFNLNVVDRVGMFMQTPALSRFRRVPSGVTCALFASSGTLLLFN